LPFNKEIMSQPQAEANPLAATVAALQEENAKQNQSLVTLHEMHSKRVKDLEEQLTVRGQFLEEAVSKATHAENSLRDALAKLAQTDASHQTALAEIEVRLASNQKECDGQITALQMGLHEVYQSHGSQIEELTTQLATTRVLLIKERQNTWNLPKVVSDAVNASTSTSAEHIKVLEQNTTAATAELKSYEEETARLRQQVTEISNRAAQADLHGRQALEAAQAKAQGWQLKFEAASNQVRALESRISLIEANTRKENDVRIADLIREVSQAQAARAAAEEQLHEKAKEQANAAATIAAERVRANADVKRFMDDAWQAKCHIVALTQEFNNAVRSLQEELHATSVANNKIVDEHVGEVKSLRQEIAQLKAVAQGSASERRQAMEKEILLLRGQLVEAQAKPRESTTRTPSKRLSEAQTSAEEENAQLRATVQKLQSQLAFSEQKADAVLAEAKFQQSTVVETMRRQTFSQLAQSQQQLQTYRTESSAATTKASTLEHRVKELENEIKQTKSDLNKTQAKLVLLEASKMPPASTAGEAEGGEDSPARKKPARRK
jgi:chromosome segregation ATPase